MNMFYSVLLALGRGRKVEQKKAEPAVHTVALCSCRTGLVEGHPTDGTLEPTAKLPCSACPLSKLHRIQLCTTLLLFTAKLVEDVFTWPVFVGHP